MDEVLTKTFQFEKVEGPAVKFGLQFPKPTPKKKKTMVDYALLKTAKWTQKKDTPQKMRDRIERLKKQRLMPKVAKKKKSKPKLPKEKTRWQLIKILDGMVSNFILNKKCMGLCMRCGKRHLAYKNKKGELKYHNYGTSHYWARDYMGTRFEVDNLDGLCWWPCHGQKWEHDKQGAYKDYMVKKLGKKGFEKLEIKAKAVTKFSIVDIKNLIANFDSIWK